VTVSPFVFGYERANVSTSTSDAARDIRHLTLLGLSELNLLFETVAEVNVSSQLWAYAVKASKADLYQKTVS